jgi:hypothetical protein
MSNQVTGFVAEKKAVQNMKRDRIPCPGRRDLLKQVNSDTVRVKLIFGRCQQSLIEFRIEGPMR